MQFVTKLKTLPVIFIISESKPDQEESAPSEANDGVVQVGTELTTKVR